MSTQLISPLRVSPDAALRCRGCGEYVAVLENLNVILHGNAIINKGSVELSPVFGLYHAPCWAREVNRDLLAAVKEGRTLLEQDYSDADLLALHDDFDAAIAKAEEGS